MKDIWNRKKRSGEKWDYHLNPQTETVYFIR